MAEEEVKGCLHMLETVKGLEACEISSGCMTIKASLKCTLCNTYFYELRTKSSDLPTPTLPR